MTEKTVWDFRFFWLTWPYVYTVNKTMSKYLTLERKQVDDVLGGADAWENVDKTAIKWKNWGHHEAFFKQIQIRSADEPSTIFYRYIYFLNYLDVQIIHVNTNGTKISGWIFIQYIANYN